MNHVWEICVETRSSSEAKRFSQAAAMEVGGFSSDGKNH